MLGVVRGELTGGFKTQEFPLKQAPLAFFPTFLAFTTWSGSAAAGTFALQDGTTTRRQTLLCYRGADTLFSLKGAG